MANTDRVRETRSIAPETREEYLSLSEVILDLGNPKQYYAFDLVEGQKQRTPAGKDWERDFILSPASAEVLTFQKVAGEWFLLLGLQSRSVLHVILNGEVHSQLLLEQFAGCLDKDESFIEAAKREVAEESGGKPKYLAPLIGNEVVRHVGRAPEPSMLFWAILEEELCSQSLDENEIISIKRYPLSQAKNEFLAYVGGEKRFFYGYEMPLETISAISTFFFLESAGIINLDAPDPEKNLLE